MGIKAYRPSPLSRRYYTVSTFEDVTATKPRKSLIVPHPKRGGRNNLGRVTAKFRGGGEKRQYRIIDFYRDKLDIEGSVKTIEYDPNRSARIALVCYKDGEYRYILAPDGLKVGNTVISSKEAPIRIGNTMPLASVPVGVEIHNLQLYPNYRSYLIRSAGTAGQILAKEADHAVIKLPSGEIRKFSLECFATIGRVSNLEHKDISIGKAGRMRHMGKRPRVRAVVKNPVDHPMGGGEGKSSGGRHPCDEKGFIAKGKKTRKQNKYSTKLILQRRK
jgi:large subunit ribosomal protein L2